MKQIISVLLPLVLIGLVVISRSNSQPDIDQVLANAAYNKVHPITDVSWNAFHEQETSFLEYMEELLRSRDVSDWPKELQVERAKNIERLAAYRVAGRFPINYDHPEKPLPCFLDRDGNLCAVANLIAESSGMDLVKKINAKYQYATVSEMKVDEINQWIASSGLTREEVITIQRPSIGEDRGRLSVGNVQPINGEMLMGSQTPNLNSGFSIRTSRRDSVNSVLQVDSTSFPTIDSAQQVNSDLSLAE